MKESLSDKITDFGRRKNFPNIITDLVTRCKSLIWPSLCWTFSSFADKDCALDRSLQFRITEAAKSLHFVCKGPSGTRLLPASGNGCADVKQVAAKYATAEFPEGEVNGSDDPITIRFSTLPEKTLKLCYQCQYPNPTASQYPDNIKKPSERPCNVEISVDAAEATPSKTTTAQTTNSEAGVFPGLGLVSTLAVALVGAAGA